MAYLCPTEDCNAVLHVTDAIACPFPFADAVVCDSCGFQGFVCREHYRNARSIMSNLGNVRRHYVRYHPDETDQSDDDIEVNADGETVTVAPMNPLDHDRSINWINIDFMSNPSVITYLTNVLRDGSFVAKKKVVLTCAHQTPNVHFGAVQRMTQKDMNIFLSMVKLLFKIGSTGQALLSTLFEQLSIAGTDNNLPLPQTVLEQRKMVTDASFAYSLINVLPMPRYTIASDDDAFVDIMQFIYFGLAMANPASDTHRYQNLAPIVQPQCSYQPEVHRTDRTPHAYVGIMLWMDDWDANQSLSKLNRFSVFSAVGVVFIVNPFGGLVGTYSNLLAVGNKHNNHDDFITNLNQVNNYNAGSDASQPLHYVDRWRNSATISTTIMGVLCDQPAKREIVGLLAGNSNLHAVFGYSIDFQNLKLPFPACAVCMDTLCRLERPERCENCLAWGLPTDNAPSRLAYTKPVFPSLDTTNNLYLLRKNIVGTVLTTACILEVWNQSWEDLTSKSKSITDVKNQLQLVCLNNNEISRFINTYKQFVLLQQAKDDESNMSPDLRAQTLEAYQASPNEFQKPSICPGLKTFHLDKMLEAPMHLQMGVVKAVMKLIFDWANDLGHGKLLVEYLQVQINMMRWLCRVDILRLVNYTPGMAGWVADNCRAALLLFPWMYQCLSNPFFTYRPPMIPSRPINQWSKQECQVYLRSRGQDFDRTLSLVLLRSTVTDLMTREEGPPDVVVPPASQVTGKDMQALVMSCHSMFESLFSCGDVGWLVEVKVKRFLCRLEFVDKKMRKDDDKPMYLSKYNMVSLLRAVPQAVQMRGMRNYHEGSQDGEGIVKPLRAMLPNNPSKRFGVNLLRSRYKQVTIDQWINNPTVDVDEINDPTPDLDETDLDSSQTLDDLYVFKQDTKQVVGQDPTILQEQHKFRRYPSEAVVRQFIKAHLPLSTVCIHSGENDIVVGVVVTTGETWNVYPLRIRMLRHDELKYTPSPFGLAIGYVESSFGEPVCVRDNGEFTDVSIGTSGFLLPSFLDMYGMFSPSDGYGYSFITNEFEHLDSTGKINA